MPSILATSLALSTMNVGFLAPVPVQLNDAQTVMLGGILAFGIKSTSLKPLPAMSLSKKVWQNKTFLLDASSAISLAFPIVAKALDGVLVEY